LSATAAFAFEGVFEDYYWEGVYCDLGEEFLWEMSEGFEIKGKVSRFVILLLLLSNSMDSSFMLW
jgi:hypothetical protein